MSTLDAVVDLLKVLSQAINEIFEMQKEIDRRLECIEEKMEV